MSVWEWRCSEREELEVGYSFLFSPLLLEPTQVVKGRLADSSVLTGSLLYH